MYLGSWNIDDYLTIPLQCSRFSTGAAYDATGSPAYRIYEDETATPVATGSFALLDDANTTGFYTERIQLTSASGFEAGKCYTVWCSATVDSVAAACVHTFQIRAATDAGNTLGTAGAGLTAIPWNSSWDAEVESECNDALVGQNLDHLVKSAVDTNFATTVHLDSVIGQLADDGTSATFDRTTDSLEAIRDDAATLLDINSEIDTALSDIGLDHLVSTSVAGADIADNSVVAKLVSKESTADWDDFDNTTDSLQATADALAVVDGNVDSILVDTGTTLDTAISNIASAIAALENLSASEVASEIADALGTDTIAAVTTDPGTTPTVLKILRLIYQALRNKITATDSELALYNDAGSAEAFTKALSDDDTTFTSGTLTDA